MLLSRSSKISSSKIIIKRGISNLKEISANFKGERGIILGQNVVLPHVSSSSTYKKDVVEDERENDLEKIPFFGTLASSSLSDDESNSPQVITSFSSIIS